MICTCRASVSKLFVRTVVSAQPSTPRFISSLALPQADLRHESDISRTGTLSLAGITSKAPQNTFIRRDNNPKGANSKYSDDFYGDAPQANRPPKSRKRGFEKGSSDLKKSTKDRRYDSNSSNTRARSPRGQIDAPKKKERYSNKEDSSGLVKRQAFSASNPRPPKDKTRWRDREDKEEWRKEKEARMKQREEEKEKGSDWRAQKAALKEKFPEGWRPRKRLSPDALEGIRALHNQFPDVYTTPVLAQRFEVSPEAIRRILKNKWRPTTDEEIARQERWFRRGKSVWARYAEMGVKPPRKWRAEGIVRAPFWNEKKRRPDETANRSGYRSRYEDEDADERELTRYDAEEVAAEKKLSDTLM